jgi:hypothetical protein
MTPQTPDLQAMLERLEKLEGQNRRLKRAVVLAFVPAVVLLGTRSTKQHGMAAVNAQSSATTTSMREIRAESFLLTDSSGRIRGSLQVNGKTPELALFDERAKRRAVVSVTHSNQALTSTTTTTTYEGS